MFMQKESEIALVERTLKNSNFFLSINFPTNWKLKGKTVIWGDMSLKEQYCLFKTLLYHEYEYMDSYSHRDCHQIHTLKDVLFIPEITKECNLHFHILINCTNFMESMDFIKHMFRTFNVRMNKNQLIGSFGNSKNITDRDKLLQYIQKIGDYQEKQYEVVDWQKFPLIYFSKIEYIF